jgi:hypothetical protein
MRSRLIHRTPRHVFVERLEERALLATFTVTSTNNSGDGSLRQAILDANAAANPTGSVDTIAFDIPGAGVHTIIPNSALPVITDPILIDGYTQPGASPNTNGPGLGDNAVLRIQLATAQKGAIASGLLVTAGGSTVRGLVITGFGSGIDLQTNGGNTVAGNFIGTAPDGLAQGSPALGEDGILLESSNNTIGGPAAADRNLVAAAEGIHVPLDPATDASNNVIQGNFIGLDATGTTGIASALDGILIESGSGEQIGGAGAGAGNLIAGIAGKGITVYLGGPTAGVARNSNGGHVIEGNLIGTDVTGTALPPFTASSSLTSHGIEQDDIFILGLNHYDPIVNPLPIAIGGTSAGAGNVIAGAQSGSGISLTEPSEFTAATSIQGNFIGTDRTGLVKLSNSSGINLNVARNVTITGNTIAYNAPKSGASGINIPGGRRAS